MRNPGAPGVIPTAREYLANLNLDDFQGPSAEQFRRALNRHTKRLQRKFPGGAHHWGLARKVLNIFLMEVNYNRFLIRAHRLAHVLPLLEVPLDSQVASGLRQEARDLGMALPRWQGVSGLRPRESQIYQEFALKLAREWDTRRVLLDLVFWRRDQPHSGREAESRAWIRNVRRMMDRE